MTARETLAWLTARLSPVGESARREARLLLENALLPDGMKLLYDSRPLSHEVVLRLETEASRRLEGEPLQYILGEWEFYSLPFEVGPGVLIPQPDTECLVERALTYLNDFPSAHVADLCSGSGAVAIAIAHHAPQCRVTAVEWDEAAFGYLERNIRRNHADHVNAVRANVLAAPQGLGPFDLIVSNPPYIRSGEIDGLEASVRREPRIALDGGEDGLTFYRCILSRWATTLTDEGALMVEIGYDQGGQVTELFAPHFAQVECFRDYGGNDRVIVGTHRR